jgi:hypothetical protein
VFLARERERERVGFEGREDGGRVFKGKGVERGKEKKKKVRKTEGQ